MTGWGECTDWLPTLKTGFEGRVIPYLIGKQASDRLQLVHHIQKWHKRIAAGISMALTEIVAKHANLSVCDLWGGSWRTSVPVYASYQSYTDQVEWVQHSVNQVGQAMDQGFTQMKVKVGGKTFREDRTHIQEIQKRMSDEHEL